MQAIDLIRNGIRGRIHLIAREVNRLTRGKLSPDAVTLAGVTMHLPIAILIGQGELIWAAILLVIFGLFDVLDGELARLQNSATSRGMFYDATADRIKETLLYAGIAYLFTSGDQAHWAFVAVVACGASITVSYAKAKGEAALALKRKITDHHVLNRHFKEGLVPFEIRMTILVLGLLFNQLLAATILIAVLAFMTIFSRVRIIGEQL